MADSLLDNYNPLYDVHLRQYFALPHMQKHLRRMGLLEASSEGSGDEVYARHHAMMDMMLKNREQQLMKMAELKGKLDATEKVETCRRIRSGLSPESYRRAKPSRSLSRGRHSAGQQRQRRFSNSWDDKETIQKMEQDYKDSEMNLNTGDAYKRLSANVKRFHYLHKMDDPTLISYKDNLKRQLQRLERFREISFGVHSVARQPQIPHTSWFFRRRSLPSLTSSAPANALLEPLRSINNLRGRKISPNGMKLNQSNDSRTSCPPTMRKRRESNPRLPPISATAKPKAKPAKTTSSAPAARLPPRPSPTRGRPVTKKETTTTAKTSTRTILPAIAGGAAVLAGAGAAVVAAASMRSLTPPREKTPEELVPREPTPEAEIPMEDIQPTPGAELPRTPTPEQREPSPVEEPREITPPRSPTPEIVVERAPSPKDASPEPEVEAPLHYSPIHAEPEAEQYEVPHGEESHERHRRSVGSDESEPEYAEEDAVEEEHHEIARSPVRSPVASEHEYPHEEPVHDVEETFEQQHFTPSMEAAVQDEEEPEHVQHEESEHLPVDDEVEQHVARSVDDYQQEEEVHDEPLADDHHAHRSRSPEPMQLSKEHGEEVHHADHLEEHSENQPSDVADLQDEIPPQEHHELTYDQEEVEHPVDTGSIHDDRSHHEDDRISHGGSIHSQHNEPEDDHVSVKSAHSQRHEEPEIDRVSVKSHQSIQSQHSHHSEHDNHGAAELEDEVPPEEHHELAYSPRQSVHEEDRMSNRSRGSQHLSEHDLPQDDQLSVHSQRLSEHEDRMSTHSDHHDEPEEDRTSNRSRGSVQSNHQEEDRMSARASVHSPHIDEDRVSVKSHGSVHSQRNEELEDDRMSVKSREGSIHSHHSHHEEDRHSQGGHEGSIHSARQSEHGSSRGSLHEIEPIPADFEQREPSPRGYEPLANEDEHEFEHRPPTPESMMLHEVTHDEMAAHQEPPAHEDHIHHSSAEEEHHHEHVNEGFDAQDEIPAEQHHEIAYSPTPLAAEEDRMSRGSAHSNHHEEHEEDRISNRSRGSVHSQPHHEEDRMSTHESVHSQHHHDEEDRVSVKSQGSAHSHQANEPEDDHVSVKSHEGSVHSHHHETNAPYSDEHEFVHDNSGVTVEFTPAPEQAESDDEPQFASEVEKKMEEDNMSTDSMIIHDEHEKPQEQADPMMQSVYQERHSPVELDYGMPAEVETEQTPRHGEESEVSDEHEDEEVEADDESSRPVVRDVEWTEGNTDHHQTESRHEFDSNGSHFVSHAQTTTSTTHHSSEGDEANNNSDSKSLKGQDDEMTRSVFNGNVGTGSHHEHDVPEDDHHNVSSI